MSDLTNEQIASTVKALLSKDYSFDAFLKDRADGAKERLRQYNKNKIRYEKQKAAKLALRAAKEKKICSVCCDDTGEPLYGTIGRYYAGDGCYISCPNCQNSASS